MAERRKQEISAEAWEGENEMTMHRLSIDLETYSSVPIGSAGAYRYVASDDFEILLFAYSLDGGDVTVIDVASGEEIPEWVRAALRDPSYIKTAFNAAFEYACLSKYIPLFPDQWRDTMLQSLYVGFPASLEASGAALGLPSDKQKLSTGKALIRYFCVPCKPTKANGGRTRNYPHHDPDKWKLFVEYNRQDVVTEMAIADRLAAFPVPPMIQKQWETDLAINTRGVAVDMDMVHGALELGARVRVDLMQEASRLSGLSNPNSVSQLTQWLNDATDDRTEITNLRKETVADLLSMDGHSPEVRRILAIRQELGKTSTKKFDAIQTCVCPDGRVRGLLQFYGANRSGRWAGRLVQVQNLPRTYITPLDSARALVTAGRLEPLRVLFGSVPDTLSQLIRTVFTATPGNVLIDADFSAIEARVVAWLSGEQWVLDAFRAGKDIYCETASQMFHVPVVKGGENGHLRQRGKVAVLACGYGGGVGAMRRMDTGHLLDGASDEDVQGLVDDWRNANSRTVAMWREMEDAALTVIQSGGRKVTCSGRVVFAREYDPTSGLTMMTVKLPSGRKLFYASPFVTQNRWGAPSIGYYGVQQTTRKWEKIETYGGKLVENVTQAVARDCLAEAIENLEAAGLPIVFHIHDEIVIDTPAFGDDETMLRRVEELMSKPIPWAPGLPLSADGWVGRYFKKD